MVRSTLVAFLLLLIGAGYWYWDRAGRLVIDDAELMTEEQRSLLERHHRYLLADYDIDYRVVTTLHGGDINDVALRTFAQTRIGSESASGRGLLLIVDAAQNRVRFEVSQALEGVYPDAFVAYLEQRQMTPFFAAGRVADGIHATTEMIVTRAQNAKANAGFEGEAWAAVATGAGAAAPARLNEGHDATFRQGDNVAAGDTPEATLTAYFAALSARNGRPDLDIYTPESRTFMDGRVLTAAQMDNSIKTFKDCNPLPTRVSDDGRFAVIRYPLENRQCSPWFLYRGDDQRWRIDLITMGHVIRFDRSNAWRAYTSRHPYHFGFEGWAFNNRGYPSKVRWGMGFQTTDHGVIITSLDDDAPALQFGFLVGDRVIAWGGETIRDHRHLSYLMDQAEPGRELVVEIERNGQHAKLKGVAPPKPV